MESERLSESVLRLKELEQKLLEARARHSRQNGNARKEAEADLASTYEEYRATVKEIKLILLDEPVPCIRDPNDREIVRKISLGKPVLFTEKLAEITGGLITEQEGEVGALLADLRDFREYLDYVLDHDRDGDELWELTSDYFYPYFGSEYVEDLLKTGVLVLPFSDLPPHLEEYVGEARYCHALQQYLALCVLCRIILEIVLNDVRHRRWIKNGDPRTPRSETATHKISALINEITQAGDTLRVKMHRLKDVANVVVHPGSRSSEDVKMKKEQALKFLQETVSLVGDLYSEYGS
jgi:hypothetical protein